jgi:predicted permease
MPEWIISYWLRGKALLLRRRLDRDLEQELAFHLAMRGNGPEARRRLGNPTLLKEQTRELWMFSSLEAVIQDVRHGVRVLGRSPVFTTIAILSPALGIGANTAIFGLMHALLVRTLPVLEPQQLMLFANGSHSYQAFQYFRDHQRVFSGIFATAGSNLMDVSVYSAEEERARVALVTGSYFPVLGVPAALGRVIMPEDDQIPGGHPVVVLSYDYWVRRFHSDPRVLGEVVRISRFPLTVIGVAAQGFSGVNVDSAADLWGPISMQTQLIPGRDWLTRQPHSITTWLDIFGRLKPGLGMKEAEPAVAALWRQHQMEMSDGPQARADLERMFAQVPFKLFPGGRGGSNLRNTYRRPLQILMAATTLVLLIACANLANLLLARAGARQREIGIRLSLGAARRRVVRQLITEGALLSCCGAMLGLLIARWGNALLLRMISQEADPVPLRVGVDWRLLGFTALVAIISALSFALWPALCGTRLEISACLKQGGTLVGRHRTNSGRLLTLAQVSLSIVLLVGAALFVRTFRNLRHLDLGFRTEHLVQLDVDPVAAGYKDATFRSICRRLLGRIGSIPGITHVTFSCDGLFGGRGSTTTFSDFAGRKNQQISSNAVGPDYFATTGIRILTGRDFGLQDGDLAAPVIIVNEALARYYFPDRTPVGEKVNGSLIVGVVQNARDHVLRQPARRLIYDCALQKAELPSVRFLIRTAANPAPVARLLRGAVRQEDPHIPILSLDPVPILIDRQVTLERMIATLAVYFALLAVFVAAMGLYGVLSQQVVRRTREIGVRMALGSLRSQILWTVLRESLVVVIVGIILGVAMALGLSRLVASLLFELKPRDGLSITGAIAILFLAAAPAVLVPAFRAARLDPARTLREE